MAKTAGGPGGTASEKDASAGTDAGTRWLNQDELAAWLANSAIMISLPAALDARMQREAQMTFFEYMVLSALSEEPERTMQMSALALRTSASLSRLSHVVGRLEKRGLLVRSRIPGAGRRTNTTLTKAGYDVVVAAAPGHVAAVREYLIDQLEPRDLKALQRIGTAVEVAIDRSRATSASPASPGAPASPEVPVPQAPAQAAKSRNSPAEG
ncbi:MarR family winged helix-turn-helix transcriptional regulator [Actinotalea sp. K2]|uniref:MarR family winged helix-turn-helix transcriptional regulator n=1 Tax=Actinotalea sp. K2 TaxID=2939438 RepID=UPI0020174D81|nr:MarR family winged helix-turn-helix transcriptional regulator [Actinotalea sp. K2]MCL3863285.1 MarR family winged helix-turn-helix transcriptional regulator [Actinotalea sp. K2]